MFASVLASLILASPAAQAASVRERAVVTGLSYPASFTFAPNGNIYFGTRLQGKIRIWSARTRRTSTFFSIPHVLTDGERGLLGLALNPQFPTKPYIYAYATRHIGGQTVNQIIRVKNAGGRAVDATVIYTSNAAASSYHDGGRVLFGPDGTLYAIVGDAHNSANSQRTSVSAGKILRMMGNGRPPSGNPFPGREYAIGIRNSFGFTFDFANTKLMWETENGPECNDELNLIRSGENHGWGRHETCSTPPAPPRNTNQDGASPVLPIRWWGRTIAPTGIVFCDACGISGAEGDLFFGAYNQHNIREDVLTANRLGIASQTVVLAHRRPVLSMERGPGGGIFFSDSQGIYKLINA